MFKPCSPYLVRNPHSSGNVRYHSPLIAQKKPRRLHYNLNRSREKVDCTSSDTITSPRPAVSKKDSAGKNSYERERLRFEVRAPCRRGRLLTHKSGAPGKGNYLGGKGEINRRGPGSNTFGTRNGGEP